MEKKLQALWSSVLEMNAESITAESSSLDVGSESIAVMRLVSAAREQSSSLTVVDVIKAPRLSDLALLVNEAMSDEYLQSEPTFALLEADDG
ncbi:hypothetical protein CCMA1212_010806 [Trichoderma ghanense]|uniref:Carrier domain-containing protein n=1 Tax=Trichoderma ghanense TaxID=65468 RepID=A0ABY2GQD3_9HYPO